MTDTSQRKHGLGEKRQKWGDWPGARGLRPAEKRQRQRPRKTPTSSLAAPSASAQRATCRASLGSNPEGPGPRIPLEGLLSWGNKSSFGRAELLDTFCKCVIKSSWKQTLCLPFISGSLRSGCGEHLCVSRRGRALGPSRACRNFKTGPHAASVTWFSSRHCLVCCDSMLLDDVSQVELRTPMGTGL